MGYVITNKGDLTTEKYFSFKAIIDGDKCISIKPLTEPSSHFLDWLPKDCKKFYLDSYSFHHHHDTIYPCLYECKHYPGYYGIGKGQGKWMGCEGKNFPRALIECLNDYARFIEQKVFDVPCFNGFPNHVLDFFEIKHLNSTKCKFGDYVVYFDKVYIIIGSKTHKNVNYLRLWNSDEIKITRESDVFLTKVGKKIFTKERDVLFLQ